MIWTMTFHRQTKGETYMSKKLIGASKQISDVKYYLFK